MAESDAELLDQFVRRKSDTAFAAIVAHYVDIVYSAALRQVRNRELAEDVTQATFIVLARRAGSVQARYLPGWLMNTARFCAKDALRRQVRRTHHEHEAAMIRPVATEPEQSPDTELAATLDDAMSRLHSRESTAVTLRFLQDKPMSDVATALGVSAHAAQKVVSRSLVKLRKILSRKAVILPTTAALAAGLASLTCKTAPAALATSAAALAGATGQSISIAKGAMTMMRWIKIKIAAAVAVTVLTGAAGVVVLSQATGAPPQPPPVAATADAAVERPLLELVGCRIKEPVDLELSPDDRPPGKVTLVQQQFPEVHWTIDPALAARVSGYALAVGPADGSIASARIQIKKDADSQGLQYELTDPGDYILKMTALDEHSKPMARAMMQIHVKPMPYTQIMVNDLQPDGTIRFTMAFQSINNSDQIIQNGGFMNSDFVQVNAMTDDQGAPIKFTSAHRGDTFQYRYQLNDPVQPRQPLMVGNSGVMPGQSRDLGGGEFLYSFTHSPGGNTPTRRVELFMLSTGATLRSVTPANLKTKTVDGRVQILIDTMIPVGGSNLVEFRYRAGGGK